MAGVNVKMGVTGISQFKQNMKVAQNSVKTLDQQLELNEKQFRATGDAEAYMQQKSELLKKKIEEQKSVVSQAEKALKQMSDQGVDKASDAFQKMQQTMLRAKSDLLDTENSLNGIDSAGADAAGGVLDMVTQLRKVNSGISFDNVTNGIKSITSSLENAARTAVRFGKQLIHSSMDSASWADDVLTRASRYGEEYDAELIQRMDNVSEFVDTDVDAIIKAKKKLSTAMGKDSNNDVFAALGIDPTNHNIEDIFWQAGEAIRGLEDDVERENMAQALFGRGWDELNPLFETGRKKYEEMLSEQTVLTNAQVEALGKEDDAVKKLEQEIETLKNQFWAGLAPAITDATTALSGLMEQFNIYLQSDEGQELLGKVGDAVGGLFEWISDIDAQQAVSTVTDALDKMKDGLEWIVEHSNDVIHAVEAIFVAWGGLKVTGGLADFFKVITSAKTLLGDSVSKAASDLGSGSATGSGGGVASWLSSIGFGALETAVTLPELALAGYSAVGLYKYFTGLFNGDEKYADDVDGTIDLINQMANEALLNHEDMHMWHDAMNDTTYKSTSELTQAAGEMQGLPGEMKSAVIEGMGGMGVYLDGEAVGRIMTPRVGGNMAGAIRYLIK